MQGKEEKETKKKSTDNSEKSLEANLHNEEMQNGSSEVDRSDSNTHLKRMMGYNFIEYASYVIKDRAIPELDDGFKPVQRRIIWSLFCIDDGRFHKVANVVGHTMQYHPHGDQSIYGALVLLANKEYFIEKQGNFGNINTGDEASAARYIECRLTPLAKETLFNNDITLFTDSYDGRNKEPVSLPAKIPSLLMLGHEGIAPGMTTRILPHNFGELLEAQIAILENRPFEIYPDFLQGGIMDISDYKDGAGKIVLRAKIEIDGRKLIIREIPAFCTTESLIASIESAVNKNKIKIAGINDYTAEKVEIELTPQRGYEPQKALNALYAYTDCEMSVSSNILIIKENRPVMITVSEALRHYTERLVEYLKKELQIELGKLNEKFHEKTLAQIFIENRIYKKIEECETYELVISEVKKGLNKFRPLLKREIANEDIEKLLAIPIRRISLFDINKNKKDIDDIVVAIEETEKNLKRIKAYTIKFIKALITKYAKQFPRRTEIVKFDKIDVKAIALNNIKVGWDKKNCLAGTEVKSEDTITCNEYDKLLCIEKTGKYKVINIPETQFVDRLFYFCKYDKDLLFNIVYRDKKTGFCYAKKTKIPKFITDKEYFLAPEGSKLEIINTRTNYVYECIFEPKPKQKLKTQILDFSVIPVKGAKARGIRIASKNIIDFRFVSAGEESPVPEPNINSVSSEEKQNPPTEEKAASKTLEGKNEPIKDPEESIPIVSQKTRKPEDKQKNTEYNKTKKLRKTQEQEKNDHPEFEAFAKIPSLPVDEKTQKKKSEKSTKKDSKKDDDWGVSQPEFGF